MADGLLSNVLGAIDRKKQEIGAGLGLLVNNPQEWAAQATARYLPTREEERQYAAVKQAGGDITQTPYYQKIFDLAQFQGQIAFHGSPYTFNNFDLNKVGTGEGAQAYGHGIYFAESPDVAKGYQMALTQKAGENTTINGKPIEQIYEQIYNKANKLPVSKAQLEYDKAAMLEKMMLDTPPSQLIQYAKDIGSDPRVIQWLEKDIAPKTKVPGSFYKVDIPDQSVATYLDWDKPLSKQKEIVAKITPESLGLEYKQLPNGNHAFLNSEGVPFGIMQKGGTKESFTNRWKEFIGMQGSGGDLYKALNQGMSNSAKTSKALNQAGIQGIQYLDQGSRSAGQGTRNFVVFDPSLVKMLERNNQPLEGLLGK